MAVFPRGALTARTTLVPVAPSSRVNRNPQHRHLTFQRPWVLQPFMIAPVLPGETLRNLSFQETAQSTKLYAAASGLYTGWWREVYFFYVKHRDLIGRDAFVSMHLNDGYDLSAQFVGTANGKTYTYAGTVDWVHQCYQRVLETYFRDDGVAYNAFKFADDYECIVSINTDSVFQSLILDTNLVGADDPTVDAAGGIHASEIQTAMRAWEWAQSANLTPMSFEDYLGSFGIRQPRKEDEHRPELVRYFRDWQMPVVSIADSTGGGVAAHVVRWKLGERADKARFFKEPGFIFGVSVCRPKVLLKNQLGAAVGLLTTARAWLPAVLSEDPLTSMVKQGETAGISPTVSGEYWLDVRDLFLHGDQFIGNQGTLQLPNGVSLPDAAGQAEYATATNANELFSAGTAADGIFAEGITSLTISGTQVDHTP